jgi:DNA-3-methyladenine glycosylase I
MPKKEPTRCPWPASDPLMIEYHDTVWGTPEHDDRKLFAKLILDGAQAGLSWKTILHRSEGYRKAFDNWNAEKIARYGKKDIARLLGDPGIIRNRAKVESAVKNAQAYLRIMEDGKGAFNDFIWKHVDHKTIVNPWTEPRQVPASTPLSDAMSKDLKKAGFSFVGTTIVYAYMQAIGMVDDHLAGCWRKARQGRR